VIDQFKIINEGSIILFEPLTDAARSWWTTNVNPEAQTMGQAYVVEHRYAGDIVEGIKAASIIKGTHSNGKILKVESK